MLLKVRVYFDNGEMVEVCREYKKPQYRSIISLALKARKLERLTYSSKHTQIEYITVYDEIIKEYYEYNIEEELQWERDRAQWRYEDRIDSINRITNTLRK